MQAEVLEDLEEHHAVEVLLDELDGLQPSDERFAAKFRVISEIVLHHLEEEESDQFPQIRDQMDPAQLDFLGEQMELRYEELRSSALAEELSKEEIYEQAKEMGIEGRSRMSKRELQAAVQSGG